MKPADAKLQRWIDLLAALLLHRFGVTFAELRDLVPAYGGTRGIDTIARMFERDKDELREIGIPIRVRVEDRDDGQFQHYYVRASEMYMPFLALVGRSAKPGTPPREGYRDVPTVAFEPDELFMLIRAANRTKALGEPSLASDAESAVRKLTYDLGLAAVASAASESTMAAPEAHTAPTVCRLGEALLRRKRVTFVHRSMSRDVVEERTVEPYGLFFASGHWYVAGRDVRIDELRSFRVSRLEQLSVNTKTPQTPDYVIPTDYRLADHARTQHAWEFGDQPPEEMVVEIRRETGAARSILSLGHDVSGVPLRRSFRVRRIDSFVRWLMSFAGAVVPVSPPVLVDEYRVAVAATLRTYGEATASGS